MPDSQVENVVLGFATNLHPERLEVFAKTLRNVYSPQVCDLVIYTNIVDEQLCRIAKEYSIIFLHSPNTYSPRVDKLSKLLTRCLLYSTRWLAISTQNIPSLKVVFYEMYVQLLKLWHHPHFVRWLSYRDFLKTNLHYKKFFISDVKDVAFQAPFFSELDFSDLNFFKQDVNYGDEGYSHWDTTWYRESYGSTKLKKMIGKPTLCIGTVSGSFKGIEAFVETLCMEILRTPFIGVEQSIFNHLVYTDAFNHTPFEVHENAAGVVLTISGESWNRFKVCSDGIFAIDGKLVPVIHMYDRHQAAMEHFSGILGHDMQGQGLVKV